METGIFLWGCFYLRSCPRTVAGSAGASGGLPKSSQRLLLWEVLGAQVPAQRMEERGVVLGSCAGSKAPLSSLEALGPKPTLRGGCTCVSR